MAEDWTLDVKRYVADADDEIIAGIVRYCGIALRNRDSSLVSFADAKETGRVRDNFLRKKLALEQPDAELDLAIAAVGARMKDASFRNRVTVYYLLAETFGKLELFRRKGATGAATGIGPGPDTTGATAAGAATNLASLAGGEQHPASPAAVMSGTGAPAGQGVPDQASAMTQPHAGSAPGSGPGRLPAWLWWLIAALVAALLIWWLFLRS